MRLKLLLFYLPTNMKDCNQCVHFIPHQFDDLSKCKMSRIKSNFTIYDYAEKCRSDENKCGIYGKNFIQK